MSAPDKSLKKQAKRHKGPLIGIIVVVTFASAAMVWMLSDNLTADPETPANGTEQVEGTVDPTEGAAEPTEDAAEPPQAIPGPPLEGDAATPLGGTDEPAVIQERPDPGN